MVRRKKLRKSVLAVMMALCLLCGTVQTSAVVYATEAEEEASEEPSDDGESVTDEEEPSDEEDPEEQTSEDGASEEEDEADDETGDESGNADENENTDSEETGDSEQVEDSSVSNLTEGESDDEEDSIETDQGEEASDSTNDVDVSVSESGETVITGLMSALTAILMTSEDDGTELDLNDGDVSVTEGGSLGSETEYTIIQSNSDTATSYVITIDASNVIVTIDGVNIKTGTADEEGNITPTHTYPVKISENCTNVTVILRNSSLDIGTKNGAGVLAENGSEVTLQLEGTNIITSSYVANIWSTEGLGSTKLSGVNIYGVRVGGGAWDGATGTGTLTVTGNGSLSISHVGAGMASSEDAKLIVSGTTVSISNIMATPGTAYGRGIVGWGELEISNEANVSISGVGAASYILDNDTATGLYYSNYGYGIVANKSLVINNATLNIDHCAANGIYGDRLESCLDASNATITITNIGTTSNNGSAITISTGSTGNINNETSYVKLKNSSLTIDSVTNGIAVGTGGDTDLDIVDSTVTMTNIWYNGLVSTTADASHVLIDNSEVSISVDNEKSDAALGGMNTGDVTISNNSIVTVKNTHEGLGLGSAQDNGAATPLTVTAGAQLIMTGVINDGICAYAANQITVTEGGLISVANDDSDAPAGIKLSGNGSGLLVNNGTVIVNTSGNGILVSGSNTTICFQDNSHVEATDIVYSADGKGNDCNFTVTGGTLTYDFEAANTLWPTNGDGSDDGVSYTAEKLTNFIVPNDSAHLSFGAAGWNDATGNSVTYSYISDTDKEGETLSIWVPAVKVFYYLDMDSDLETLQGVTLTDATAAEFTLYSETYDVVIRGQSLNFSVNSEKQLQYAFPALGDRSVENCTETTKEVFYPETIEVSGTTMYIYWFYNKTKDYGPLTAFGKTSDVMRGSTDEIAVACVYGILSDTEPTKDEPDIDKTATSLNDDNQTTVSLTVGAGSEQEKVAVLFVLDYSTSVDVRNEAAAFLDELAGKTNTDVKACVINYWADADTGEWISVSSDTDASTLLAMPTNKSGTNLHAGLLAAKEALGSEDIEGYETYLIVISDGITYLWTDDDTTSDTYGKTMSVWYQNNGNGTDDIQNGNSVYEMKYGSGNEIPVAQFVALVNGTDEIVKKYSDTITKAEVYATSTKPTATETERFFSYYDNSTKESVKENYLIGTEIAIYKSAEVYRELLDMVDNAYALKLDEKHWSSYPYGEQLMDYLASLDNGGEITAGTAKSTFAGIRDQILYQIQSGTITDVIGADFTLTDAGAITDSTFTLTVEGITATVTSVSGNVVTFNNGDFVLTYYQGTTMDNGNGTYTITATDGTTYTYIPCETGDEINGAVSDEFFTLEINIPIGALELTYNLTLTSLQTLDGTYTVPTNETAVLEYTSSDGTEGEEEFPEPTVGYEVEDTTVTPTDPTPDPGTSETSTETSTETTTETSAETTDPQETVSTVASEVVSAVTGDNAPIGIAILLAAISEITLITLIVLQMRKKKNSAI